MKRSSRSSRWTSVRRFPPSLLLVTLLPLLLNSQLCLELWQGSRAQAWDGSGHYALAEGYNQSTFPETFGWTSGYFAGIAFPNFYPPLFYFLVALLAHTHLFSFAVAFKIVLVVPELLLPATIWWLAYRLSAYRRLSSLRSAFTDSHAEDKEPAAKGRRRLDSLRYLFGDRLTAACASLALLPLLVDERFTNSTGVIGLSHASTFLLGLYTQPLGFVLLMAWFVSYGPISFSLSLSAATALGRTERQAEAYRTFSRGAVSAVLLALALLANFFSSNVAALMVVTVVGYDLFKLWHARRAGESRAGRSYYDLIAHLAIPVLALCLIMFWLAPLINSYSYVVTRPVRTPLAELVPPIMWPWYALAAVGALIWLRTQKEGLHIPFLITCGLLFLTIIVGATIAPRWFPFQANRLTSTLNFMLAVPVGQVFAAALSALGFGERGQSAKSKGQRAESKERRAKGKAWSIRKAITVAVIAFFAVLPALALISPGRSDWAYYDNVEWSRIAPVLQFGAEHSDGRYLVENLPFTDIDNAHDARAINAHLGAQGNEVLSLFFREAAPNVLFLNPLVDSLSSAKDTYGISSELTEDTEFAKQPLEQHLAQARLFSTKYVVVHSDLMKGKLGAERGLNRHDFGQWTVFDLGGGSQPAASALAYKPALVVANLSFKTRRTNDYDFVRLAEEQFASGWYDVLLARAREMRLDRLDVPPGFDALIIATYAYDNLENAFAKLKEFAQTRPLLLLSDQDPLFQKIKASAPGFPQLEIINRPQGAPGAWIESDRATKSYADNGPRQVWQKIKQVLERKKVPVSGVGIKSDIAEQTISIAPDSSETSETIGRTGMPALVAEGVPVLINTTFHPNWQRRDGGAVYPVTPFLMLTFVDKPTTLVFERRWFDKLGLWVSAVTLAGILGLVGLSLVRKIPFEAPA